MRCPLMPPINRSMRNIEAEEREEEEPVDEETQRFNFWTHQIHIFFVCKFFPAVERYQTIQCMAQEYEQAIRAGC